MNIKLLKINLEKRPVLRLTRSTKWRPLARFMEKADEFCELFSYAMYLNILALTHILVLVQGA